MNDTVGTMMTCSMGGNPCEVALVVGEEQAPCVPWWWVLGGGLHQCSPPPLPTDKGTNSCFMAEAQQVEMAEETSGRMCINTEWGGFGDDGSLGDILTPYDQLVDQESSNPGQKRCSHSPARTGSWGSPSTPEHANPTSRTTWPPAMLLGALKGGAEG